MGDGKFTSETGRIAGKKSKRKSLGEEWKKVDPDKLFDTFMRLFEEGNVRAGEIIADRVWGKVTQGIDHTTDGEPIKTTFNLIGTPTEDE